MTGAVSKEDEPPDSPTEDRYNAYLERQRNRQRLYRARKARRDPSWAERERERLRALNLQKHLSKPRPHETGVVRERKGRSGSPPIDSSEGERPQARVIRSEIDLFKENLPEFKEGETLRFGGRDYQIGDEGLRHVHFPSGKRRELEQGDLFRVGGVVYWVRESKAVQLSDGEIVETIFEWEAEDAAESDEASEDE